MSTTNRALVIRTSLAVFVCGLLGWVPVLGLVPAAYAVVRWFRVRSAAAQDWNPGSAYLKWGVCLGALALLLNLLLLLVIGLCIADELANSGTDYDPGPY